MERGTLVAAVFSREFGKPRPALVIQADAYGSLGTLTLLPLTTDVHGEMDFRVDVLPTDGNGLRRRSQIMIDKAQTVVVSRVGRRIGLLDAVTQQKVDLALALFLGFA